MDDPKRTSPETKLRRLSIADELRLALLPTATVLAMLWLLGRFGQHHLLCASLASSAFLIYLDPRHQTNGTRTLVFSQVAAMALGWTAWLLLGPGYVAVGTSMVALIVAMILLNAIHPPAISTALAFAMRTDQNSGALLFGLAVSITAVLILLHQAMRWLLVYISDAKNSPPQPPPLG